MRTLGNLLLLALFVGGTAYAWKQGWLVREVQPVRLSQGPADGSRAASPPRAATQPSAGRPVPLPDHAGGSLVPARTKLAPAGPRSLPTLRSFGGWQEGASAYESAVREQKSSGAPILVYFAADWCPYCKQLESAVLPNGEVQSAISTAVKVRIEPEAGPAEKALAGKFGIRGYPSLLLIPAADASPLSVDEGVARGQEPNPARLVESYGKQLGYAWYMAAKREIDAGRFDEGIAAADRLIALKPDDGNAYHLRASAFSRKGAHADVLRDLSLACDRGAQSACAQLKR